MVNLIVNTMVTIVLLYFDAAKFVVPDPQGDLLMSFHLSLGGSGLPMGLMILGYPHAIVRYPFVPIIDPCC